MHIRDLQQALEGDACGESMHRLIEEAYPICRSITGRGVRDTLRLIARNVPLAIHEVPSGTRVLDWIVPPEWNIRDAYIADAAGSRVVDFRACNLHVLGYSVPVRKRMTLAELRPHLLTLPERPEVIPYRTSYYREAWGFCLSDAQLQSMPEGPYEVCIDSTLEPGHLTYGEYYLRGAVPEEVLISCHICHPSLCNDNLSGVALAAVLAQHLTGLRLHYSYRFLFIPGTIGSITWLARNEAQTTRIKHGLVVTGVGDSGRTTYKRSRRGTAEIDRAAEHVLRHSHEDYEVMDFVPWGYDERQYCSPGFDLPVGCLMRTPHGRYPEYHTSADDLTFVRPSFLADSFKKCAAILAVLEDNATYLNLHGKGEPQLGRRGLYRAIGGHPELRAVETAMLWVLNLADGTRSLLQIAERAGLPFGAVRAAAELLLEHQLLGGDPHTYAEGVAA